MAGLEHFQISLEDNPANVYYSGDTIKGKISFGLGGEGKKARGVCVEFKGQALVEFTKMSRNGQSSHLYDYADEETYFKEQNYVIGDGSNETQIPAGEYEFPFQFQLPENIPSSFMSQHGRVAYSVAGVIGDQETIAFFTVVCEYDLTLPKPTELVWWDTRIDRMNLTNRTFTGTLRELAESPQSVSGEKHMCFCWCRSGPLSASGQTKRTGYVPGETIYAQVMADNKSNVLIKEVKISLIQTQIYKADMRRELGGGGSGNLVVASVIRSIDSKAPLEPGPYNVQIQLEPGESESWDIAFEIPALPPSELEHCNKIDIEYSIQIEMAPKGCHRLFEVAFPIIIGSRPIESSVPSLKEREFRSKKVGFSAAEKGGAHEMKELFSESKEGVSSPQPKSHSSCPCPLKMDNENATGNWDYLPLYSYYGVQEA